MQVRPPAKQQWVNPTKICRHYGRVNQDRARSETENEDLEVPSMLGVRIAGVKDKKASHMGQASKHPISLHLTPFMKALLVLYREVKLYL